MHSIQKSRCDNSIFNLTSVTRYFPNRHSHYRKNGDLRMRARPLGILDNHVCLGVVVVVRGNLPLQSASTYLTSMSCSYPQNNSDAGRGEAPEDEWYAIHRSVA